MVDLLSETRGTPSSAKIPATGNRRLDAKGRRRRPHCHKLPHEFLPWSSASYERIPLATTLDRGCHRVGSIPTRASNFCSRLSREFVRFGLGHCQRIHRHLGTGFAPPSGFCTTPPKPVAASSTASTRGPATRRVFRTKDRGEVDILPPDGRGRRSIGPLVNAGQNVPLMPKFQLAPYSWYWRRTRWRRSGTPGGVSNHFSGSRVILRPCT
jgi:hypothetical protein